MAHERKLKIYLECYEPKITSFKGNSEKEIYTELKIDTEYWDSIKIEEDFYVIYLNRLDSLTEEPLISLIQRTVLSPALSEKMEEERENE